MIPQRPLFGIFWAVWKGVLDGMLSRGPSRKGSAVYVLPHRPENTRNPGGVESEAGGKEVWMRSAKKMRCASEQMRRETWNVWKTDDAGGTERMESG